MRNRRSGKLWVGYYYDGRDENGRRKEIPLGTDLDEARIEWARLERKVIPKPQHLMGAIFDKFEREIIPGKKPRPQQDNRNELKQLRKAFESAPINAITHISEEFLLVGQGKTGQRLRIRLTDGGKATGLGAFLDDLLERRALNGIKGSHLITNTSGLRMSYPMLRNRWDEARAEAARRTAED